MKQSATTEIERKKEYLKSYQKAKSQVQRIERKIEELRLDKICPTIRNDGMPRASGHKDLSDYAAKLDLEMRRLQKARYKRICQFKVITDKIERLDDEREKDVLTYRYIQGLNWEDICLKMGYTWQHIHRIHSKAVENFKM